MRELWTRGSSLTVISFNFGEQIKLLYWIKRTIWAVCNQNLIARCYQGTRFPLGSHLTFLLLTNRPAESLFNWPYLEFSDRSLSSWYITWAIWLQFTSKYGNTSDKVDLQWTTWYSVQTWPCITYQNLFEKSYWDRRGSISAQYCLHCSLR